MSSPISPHVELWFDTAPPPTAVAMALERFGTIHEMRDGLLRLVEGDEDPAEGVPLQLIEQEDPPAPVLDINPLARATLRASAVLTGSRGFWMGRVAAELQRRLGGVVYIPSSGQAYADVKSFEASWPSEHGDHGAHGHAEHAEHGNKH